MTAPLTAAAFHDLETFSERDLKTYGTHAYAEKAEILLWAYALGDDPVRVWDATADPRPPAALLEILQRPSTRHVWHNGGMFDRTIMKHARPDLHALIPEAAWWDTMVQAYTHALPGALDILCDVMNVPLDQRKLKTGKAFIQLFCKPRPKNMALRRATRHTHPAEWAQFVEYAGQDIEAMRVIYRKMPTWNYTGEEFDLWLLDQRINQRGVLVDRELAQTAVTAVERAKKSLAARTVELTDGAVESATKRDKLLAHLLAEYGVELPDLQASTLERRIEDQALPWALRELLAIRLQASTSSTSKYKRLINGASADGRLRGLLQFAGAGRTRRWAGRLWQPQNLPRPKIGTLRDEALQDEIDFGIDAIKTGAADLIYENVMEVASAAIRGCIVAPRGKKLVVADLANIEGRDAAWLAGESWKLQAFRDFDAGIGADLYKVAYAKAFGVRPEDVDKTMRQIGKVMELMLAYQGGVGAFLTGALTYGFDIEQMAEDAYPGLPDDIRDEAKGMYDWTVRKRRSTFGLSERAFVVCDSFKRAWRRGHTAIEALWGALEESAIRATRNPGTTVDCGRFRLRRDGAWLRIRMPSGRFLCYPSPQVDDNGKFSYMGVNQYSRKWTRLHSYGGKLFENACQSFARDILAHNMPAVEAAGYQIVLTVHDEIITEAPDSPEFNAAHLASIMATPPAWAPDIPLAAAGFEALRYRKE
ncbi:MULTISPECIES: DNA polymerase I [Achromobacter]|uniref:DNA polymerase I n=1 Tax=Achromobacter TaxID=222 RepID=UPI0006C57F1F|nr:MULTISPECIES: DNA polymerase I [Achromobacter]CUJ71947.1 bifunctional 3'-5' exonuclease/DNA polymerase [Achromobacter sp. 2789STDY5608628]CUJ76978.1 bifunctional 3'-5' exonuclease/DNA polymerase [Achromobacter sp. 2789STDY5608633]